MKKRAIKRRCYHYRYTYQAENQIGNGSCSLRHKFNRTAYRQLESGIEKHSHCETVVITSIHLI